MLCSFSLHASLHFTNTVLVTLYLHEASGKKHAQQLHDSSMLRSICVVYAYSCVRHIAWCRLQYMQITIFV